MEKTKKTASTTFHQIMRESTSPKSLIISVMGYNAEKSCHIIKYGRDHEDDAFEAMRSHLCNLNLRKAGFNINPKWPFLGASPNGIVESPGAPIELKCPPELTNGQPISCLFGKKNSFLDENGLLKS